MNSVQSFSPVVLRFKRFSRKNYALFACLGKVVLVGVLSVATLQNAKASGVGVEIERTANDTIPTDKEYDLSEIEVSGTRAPLSAGQAARIVTVLQPQDIQAAAVQSVNDLLKLCVGVDVRQRAPLGAQTDISMRGGTSEHIAILLNGICISDPQTGHNTLDLPVQISEILRVEILEGPAARVYGAQSLLGAINIVTQDDRHAQESSKPSLAADVKGGSFGSLSAGAAVKLPTLFSSWTNQFSGSYYRSDGFSRAADGSQNSDYEGSKLYYQGALRLGESGSQSVTYSLGGATKRWGSSTSYGLGSDSQYEKTYKYFANIKGNLQIGERFHIVPAVYWQQNNDRYYWKRGVSTPNRNTTNIFGENLNVWFDWIAGRTSAGFEAREERLVSSNMQNTSRTNLSAHLEHNIYYHGLSVSAGLFAIRNTFNNMPWKIYPSIDAAYEFAPRWKAYASWNMSMRLPTYTELYYKVDGHLADPNLKPEEMNAVEVGVKHASHYGQASLSLYHHHGKNMIDWIIDTRDGSSAVWTSVNHAQLNSYGAELQSHWNLLHVFPTQKILKTFTLGYNYIHQEQKKEDYIQSRYTLEYLRHKVVAGLTLHYLLDLTLNYRLQDRIGSFTNAAGEKVTYSPYSIVDAKAEWSHSFYTLYLEAYNIFSKKYYDYGNVQQPGAWFMGGVKLKL